MWTRETLHVSRNAFCKNILQRRHGHNWFKWNGWSSLAGRPHRAHKVPWNDFIHLVSAKWWTASLSGNSPANEEVLWRPINDTSDCLQPSCQVNQKFSSRFDSLPEQNTRCTTLIWIGTSVNLKATFLPTSQLLNSSAASCKVQGWYWNNNKKNSLQQLKPWQDEQ